MERLDINEWVRIKEKWTSKVNTEAETTLKIDNIFTQEGFYWVEKKEKGRKSSEIKKTYLDFRKTSKSWIQEKYA